MLQGTGGTFTAIDETNSRAQWKQPSSLHKEDLLPWRGVWAWLCICWHSSQGLGGLKGIFPFSLLWDGQQPDQCWTWCSFSLNTNHPIKTVLPTWHCQRANHSAHVPCHSWPDRRHCYPSAAGTQPLQSPPATSQRFPIDLHCQPGTKQQHRVAAIWILIITTSAIQVTIFKLLLIAIHLCTQQPNWIYSRGGRGQCLVFRSWFYLTF